MLESMHDMQEQIAVFQKTVWAHYAAHGRGRLPWRQPEGDGSFDPYKILVSELMLQQTQVARVIPKFEEFLQLFPTFSALAAAPLGEVLKAWSGLGYNRRAKFLWQAAQAVVRDFDGQLPRTSAELVQLPGIGPNTAGALLAYAYNIPSVFIETNVRTVFIHHFFTGREGVADRDILELVAASVPDDPRHWYWALMDYGTHLKQAVGNLNKSSKHYTVQSKFHGSKRQLRGKVLRLLAERPQTPELLVHALDDERAQVVLDDLATEGLIVRTDEHYKLPGA